jgi:transcription initiation factor IIE alpha subunit
MGNKCPYCGSYITELKGVAMTNVYYKITINDKQYIQEEKVDEENLGWTEFRCPECDEIITIYLSEAEQFLNGKGNKKQEE